MADFGMRPAILSSKTSLKILYLTDEKTRSDPQLGALRCCVRGRVDLVENGAFLNVPVSACA